MGSTLANGGWIGQAGTSSTGGVFGLRAHGRLFPAAPLLNPNYITTASKAAVQASSATYSAVSIGEASPARQVIVVIGCIEDNAAFIQSVTIGGVTATIDAVNTNAASLAGTMAIARAAVSSGTTADIVVSSSGDLYHGQIAVYNIYNNLSVIDTDFTNSSSTSVLTSSISTARKGFILAGTQQRNGSSALTPSGWTSDVNNDWSSNEWFQSISRTTDGTSLTPNITGLSDAAGVAVAYKPA